MSRDRFQFSTYSTFMGYIIIEIGCINEKLFVVKKLKIQKKEKKTRTKKGKINIQNTTNRCDARRAYKPEMCVCER